MHLVVDLLRETKEWNLHKNQINKNYLKNVAKIVFDNFPSLTNSTIEFSILLSNDIKLQELNLRLRSKDKTTDVISVQAISELNWTNLDNFKFPKNIYIGDIAFGYNKIEIDAKAQNKSFINHFTHLFIHSLLHLIGFDHQTENDSKAMEDLEVRFLSTLEINDPYSL